MLSFSNPLTVSRVFLCISVMPEIDLYDHMQRPENDVIRRSQILRRHNDSLDSAGELPDSAIITDAWLHRTYIPIFAQFWIFEL